MLTNCDDVIYRRCFVLFRPAILIYVDGLTDKKTLEQHVLKPLSGMGRGDGEAGEPKGLAEGPAVPAGQYGAPGGGRPKQPGAAGSPGRAVAGKRLAQADRRPAASLTAWLLATLSTHRVREVGGLEEAVAGLLEGEALLLVDGAASAYLIEARGFPKRNVEEAKNEMVVRGARESFTETLSDNLALVRRYLPDARLKVRVLSLGSRTRTKVAILYLEDIASSETVREVLRRLGAIQIEGMLESHYLEEMIRDHPWTPFPLLQHTERADKTAAGLLEGRVILLTDRSPHALIVPTVFWDFFQTAEDYHFVFPVAVFFRWLRLGASLLHMFLEGAYIALLGVNPEFFPTALALSVSGTRQGVPFGGWLELLLMDLAMEVFREATIRLPGIIGPAVGIVGGTILGTAAVEAGLVSNIVVIVVAATAITSFAAPSYSLAVAFRLCRYFVLLWSSLFGIYGLVLAFVLVQLHLVGLQCLGIPYFAPLAPFQRRDLGDVLARVPLAAARRRPSFTASPRPARLARGWREADEFE